VPAMPGFRGSAEPPPLDVQKTALRFRTLRCAAHRTHLNLPRRGQTVRARSRRRAGTTSGPYTPSVVTGASPPARKDRRCLPRGLFFYSPGRPDATPVSSPGPGRYWNSPTPAPTLIRLETP